MDVRRRAALVTVIAGWPPDPPRGLITRFCQREGVSRDWVHQIRRRLAEEGLAATLTPRPRTPRSSPTRIDPVVAEFACAVRLELIAEGWDAGPISVQARMRARGVEPPSAASLSRIFTAAKLVTPQPKKRPRSSWRRFVYPLPNGCWQLDAFQHRLLDGTAVAVFQITDDHARYAIASLAASGETGAAALTVVKAGIARHGVPQRLLTDNGSAFNLSRRGAITPLTAYLTVLGVDAITGRPGHPTTQGKNERHHATTQRWLDKQPPPASLTDLQALLDRFDHAYNTERPHQALTGRTPADAYTALPKATPPEPPTTPATIGRQTTITRTVDSRGTIYAARRQFKIGRAHTGRTITVLHDGTLFHLIDDRGTILDTHIAPPTDSYIPRNQPSAPA